MQVRDIHEQTVALVRLDGRAGVHAIDDEHRFAHAVWRALDLRDDKVICPCLGRLTREAVEDEVLQWSPLQLQRCA